MGRLSTHVLDTMHGWPAADVLIELRRIDSEGSGRIVTTTRTNSDGRTSEPLMYGELFAVGCYELRFHVGDYFRRIAANGSRPAFLDVVPIWFRIDEPDGHYHIPLLVTPWSYSAYRGS